MNNIYILDEDGKKFETCYLLEPSKQYKDCILEEIVYNFELISDLKEMQKDQQNRLNIDIDNEIEKIALKAKKEKSKVLDYSESKSKKIKGIKTNRGVEKEINRENEAFKIGKEEYISNKITEVVEVSSFNKASDENQNLGKDRIMEMLIRKRDERNERE